MNTDQNNPPSRKYKRYEEAFKRSTVEHWMLSGQSARQVAAGSGEKGEKQMVVGAAKNFDPTQWHSLKLQFAGSVITGFVDGAQVLTVTNDLHSRGMAGLVTGKNTACFDSLLVNAVGAASPKPTLFTKNPTPIYDL